MKKGFTLLEMLVVVLIIGILAGIALPQYQNAKIKADFAEAYIKLKAAAQIEEMCRLRNGVEYCREESCNSEINTEVNGCQNSNCSDFDSDKEIFRIFPTGDFSSSHNILASALYSKEGVCVCITKDYKFILTLDCGAAATKDYSKILGIPDVTEDEDSPYYDCSCC